MSILKIQFENFNPYKVDLFARLIVVGGVDVSTTMTITATVQMHMAIK